MALSTSHRLYEMGQKLRDEEAARKKTPLPEHLREPLRSSRPLGRTVEAAELESWFKEIAAVNQWFALTARNLDIVSKIFLFDERIPLTRNQQDLVLAIKIAKAEHRLDVNAPPPPPKPQYVEEGLADWELPMPSPEWVLRKATKEQLASYIPRAKAYEKWLKEQEQSISSSSN